MHGEPEFGKFVSQLSNQAFRRSLSGLLCEIAQRLNVEDRAHESREKMIEPDRFVGADRL